MNLINLQRILNLIYVLVILVTTSILLVYITNVAYPFVIAFVIAFLINPIVNFFEEKMRFPRILAVFITLLLFIGGIITLFVLFVVEIINGANYLSQVLPGYLLTLFNYLEIYFNTKVIPFYQDFLSLFNHLNKEQQQSITLNIGNLLKELTNNLGLFLSSFFSKIPYIFTWIPTAATGIIVSLLGTFFISKDWYKLQGMMKTISPPKIFQGIILVVNGLKSAFFGFLKAQAMLIILTIITLFIGFIVLDVEYAITIALIIGLVDIIPYLGTGLIFIPWILFEMFTTNYPAAIGLGVLYLVIVVQRQVLEPKILSSSIGLHPLATLMAVFIGYNIFGILGLIVGPIFLIILTTLHKTNVLQDTLRFILGPPTDKKM